MQLWITVSTSVWYHYELLVLSLEEERVIADEEKCLLKGLVELGSFFMKCRFSRSRVLLTLSTTKPSMSMT